jgi:hypothetical protein
MIPPPASSPLVTTPHPKPEQDGTIVDSLDVTPGDRRRPANTVSGADASGDIVDEWGRQSFPASDPPANW